MAVETQEKKLHLALNSLATQIVSKWDSQREGKRERYDHSRNNYASEIHHPCLKMLVHARRDWQKRQLMDLRGEYRTEEGRKGEWTIKQMFGDIGLELEETQRKFYLPDSQISGRIDGFVVVPKEFRVQEIRKAPVEIKTISPHDWNRTESIADILRHPKFWINKIPSQLNLYLSMTGSPGGLLALKTFGKRPRVIPMVFDKELYDYDTQRAARVNNFVDLKKYPDPIPYDPDVCDLCPFNHICTPLKATEYVSIEDDGLVVDELKEYLALKEENEKFKGLEKKLIGDKKKPGRFRGVNAIVENIQIRTRREKRKKYDVPKEEKEKYFIGEDEVVKTSIDWVKK